MISTLKFCGRSAELKLLVERWRLAAKVGKKCGKFGSFDRKERPIYQQSLLFYCYQNTY
jgi:hypothetical protein